MRLKKTLAVLLMAGLLTGLAGCSALPQDDGAQPSADDSQSSIPLSWDYVDTPHGRVLCATNNHYDIGGLSCDWAHPEKRTER